MKLGDPKDPLLLQVIPSPAEQEDVAGFVADPCGDIDARQEPGLIHKYQGRVLLITTGICAIHCRYCFRRHYPYQTEPAGIEAFEPALDAIAADPALREVILSGGDPLTRTDAWLGQLAQRLANIPHLETLRIHTRLPVVLPDRVNDELITWLTSSRLTPVVVLHANHPAELVGDCVGAIGRLRDAGILLLNQSVLLAEINDEASVLAELSRRLVSLGVLPYYLHQLDRVRGSSSFEVSEEKGRSILAELRRQLPGYMIPKYVRESPGSPHKIPIA
jgi:EF-P beta-lysylation protein EpmB